MYIYPVKSLGGIAVNSCHLSSTGFENDRQWMLVNSKNEFITQRQYHCLAHLITSINQQELTLFNRTINEQISIPINYSNYSMERVTIWDDVCLAKKIIHPVNEWLSHFIGENVSLVQIPKETVRTTDPKYTKSPLPVSFSDGYPILVISEASLAELNSKTDVSMEMERFRPNIVVSGCAPRAEETWENFEINHISFSGVKPCARCVLTTIDPKTGEKGKEPLATLATYNKRSNRIIFGQNVICNQPNGTIHIGDLVTVQTTKMFNFLP